jgi:hypothetical protein
MNTTPEDRAPLNFNPADGTYTFRIGKLKETDVKRSSKGTPMVFVPLIGTDLIPFQIIEDGKEITVQGNVYVKTPFFVTPKAIGRALDLIEQATGTRPASGAIKDEFNLADAIAAAQGKFVKADIKKGESRERNGKTFTDYEVSGFKAPF